MPDKNKKIEVVTGNGENLDISPVYKHLPVARPKTKAEKTKNIVIPTPKKRKK